MGSLASRRRHALGHLLRDAEHLGEVLGRHALELLELGHLAEPGKPREQARARTAGAAADLPHHLLHREEAIEQTADVLLGLPRSSGDALDALVADDLR